MTRISGLSGGIQGTSGLGQTQTPSQPSQQQATPGSTYTVKSGDNLWNIAKEAFGDGARWREIAEANPGAIGENGLIHPGAELKIPADAKADTLTKNPANTAKVLGNATAPNLGQTGVQPGTVDPGLTQALNAARHNARAGQTAALKAPEQPVTAQPGETSTTDATEAERTFTRSKGAGESKASRDMAKRDMYKAPGSRVRTKTVGGFLDSKKDVADEAGGKKLTTGMSATATIAAKELYNDRATAWKAGDLKGEGIKLGASGKATGEIRAGHVEAKAVAAFGLDMKSKGLKADISGRAAAEVVGAEGKITSGVYGGTIAGETSVTGKAFVGAEATGNATLSIGKGNANISAGVDAFAGAKASVEVNQSGFIGDNYIGSVGAKGEVYAGVGVKAKGTLGYTDGRLKAEVELGAALGVGAGIKLNVNVDVKGTVNAVKDGVNAGVEMAGQAYDVVANKASAAKASISNAASSAWNSVTSWW